jgi:hypothetical protein
MQVNVLLNLKNNFVFIECEYSLIYINIYRLIIYSVKCCIASPSIKNVENIHVIIHKQFYYTGKLQEHLCNLKIQVWIMYL